MHLTYYRPQRSCGKVMFLPPANEVCEGYVFTPVCQSFCSRGVGVGGVCLPHCMLGYTSPWAGTPPGRYTPTGTSPSRYTPWAGTPPQVHPLPGTPPTSGVTSADLLVAGGKTISIDILVYKYWCWWS